MLDSVKNNIELLYVHIAVKFLDLPDLEVKASFIAMWKMIEEKPRYIPDTVGIAIKNLFTEAGYVDWLDWDIERIVINNHIWGDQKWEKFTFDQNRYKGISLEQSLIYNILKDNEGTCMRVNVLHPMFLSDQHLVAEYREVKMGPKALSRSLGSLKGVDRKKISPKYTLNTGHTYFFYDKNKFLEDRLALIVEEMKFRGFATNHIELLDDSYDYHKDTFNDEWWGNWIPDEEAVRINMERINERFYQKSLDPNTKGWYKLFGHSVSDMNSLISARTKGFVNICKHCSSIIDETELLNTEFFCWWCCSKLEPKDLEIIQLTKREQKVSKDESLDSEQQEEPIIKKNTSENNLLSWKNITDYYLTTKNEENLDLQIKCQEIKLFIINKLEREPEINDIGEISIEEVYDDFDLENLFELLSFIISKVSNKREMIDWFLNGIKNQESKNFLEELFSQV